jgi:hypothetical protein
MSSLSLSLSLLPSKFRQSHSNQQMPLKIAASSGSLRVARRRAPADWSVG